MIGGVMWCCLNGAVKMWNMSKTRMQSKAEAETNEFWEAGFREIQTSWGFEAADSAIAASAFFLNQNAKEVLIPGIGYGRNAKVFTEKGINITGIEISKTAIELAKTAAELNIEIHHGSVTEMPFDDKIYDGIFCYALVHLLNFRERRKFIRDCYEQLKPGGYMIFTVTSKQMSMFGSGKQLSKDRFKLANGLSVFFYDGDSVQAEFGKYGLLEFKEIDEPVKHMKDEAPLKMLWIKCQRSA